MKKRYVSLLAISLLALSGLVVSAQSVSETKWHASRVDNDYMNRQVDSLAEQYKEYVIPKTGIFDIGYPKDAAEYEKLDGYGLFLLTSVSQTKDELPVKRLYVVKDNKQIDLVMLKMYLSENSDTTSQTFKTFGRYRMDSIYAFPVYLRYAPAEIYVEWANDTKPMRVARFDGTLTTFLKGLPGTQPKGRSYPATALDVFMRREYPGYFDK
jgi:hypothetical protein